MGYPLSPYEEAVQQVTKILKPYMGKSVFGVTLWDNDKEKPNIIIVVSSKGREKIAKLIPQTVFGLQVELMIDDAAELENE